MSHMQLVQEHFSPYLPRHDESTTYTSWYVFRRENRHSNFLESHTDSKEYATHSKLTPRLAQTHTEGCQK